MKLWYIYKYFSLFFHFKITYYDGIRKQKQKLVRKHGLGFNNHQTIGRCKSKKMQEILEMVNSVQFLASLLVLDTTQQFKEIFVRSRMFKMAFQFEFL